MFLFCYGCFFFFFKQKTAYEMRISDWSSDVCSSDLVEELLTRRELGPLPGFISKMGRPFAALLRITDEYKLEFDFGQKDDEDTEPVDFSGHTSVGTCPKCNNKVYEHGMNYVCEKTVGQIGRASCRERVCQSG